MCRTIARTADPAKQAKLKNSICILCSKSDGFLKKLKIEKEELYWIHIGCMSWFTSIKLVNEDGFTVFQMDKKFEDNIWMAEDCFSCKKTMNDFFIKCTKGSCNRYFHSKCAFQSKNIDTFDWQKKIKYKIFFCEEHASRYYYLNIKILRNQIMP